VTVWYFDDVERQQARERIARQGLTLLGYDETLQELLYRGFQLVDLRFHFCHSVGM
jgi:hypothetical protein